jgi:hypothetical protein
VYSYKLADCSDDKAQRTGVPSSCQRLNLELDREMPCALIKKIGSIIREVTPAWNKVFPPFRITIPAQNAYFKYNNISLNFELPKSAFIAHYYQELKQNEPKILVSLFDQCKGRSKLPTAFPAV